MKIFSFLALFGGCLLQTAPILAQGTTPVQQHILTASPDAWFKEKWTGDNQPYYKMRHDIDQALAQGRSAAILASQYEAAAQAKPYDPIMQYRWAYTLGQAALASHPLDDNKMLIALHVIEGARSPQTYDYTRLHFLLLTVQPRRFVPKLEAVGERLLHQTPQDKAVKRQLVTLLGCSPSKADRNKAIVYASELVKQSPTNASDHANLASAYLNRWFAGQEPTAKAKAIAEFQTYLRLAPANAVFRPRAEYLIKTLQNWGTHKQ